MLTNSTAVERFEQARGAEIANMYWLAAIADSDSMIEILEDFDEDDFHQCFPDLADKEIDYSDTDWVYEVLCDYDKYGFLAKVQMPYCRNFRFNPDGKPTGWECSRGLMRLFWVYAETTEELLDKIEAEAEKVFLEFIEQDKAENK